MPTSWRDVPLNRTRRHRRPRAGACAAVIVLAVTGGCTGLPDAPSEPPATVMPSPVPSASPTPTSAPSPVIPSWRDGYREVWRTTPTHVGLYEGEESTLVDYLGPLTRDAWVLQEHAGDYGHMSFALSPATGRLMWDDDVSSFTNETCATELMDGRLVCLGFVRQGDEWEDVLALVDPATWSVVRSVPFATLGLESASWWMDQVVVMGRSVVVLDEAWEHLGDRTAMAVARVDVTETTMDRAWFTPLPVCDSAEGRFVVSGGVVAVEDAGVSGLLSLADGTPLLTDFTDPCQQAQLVGEGVVMVPKGGNVPASVAPEAVTVVEGWGAPRFTGATPRLPLRQGAPEAGPSSEELPHLECFDPVSGATLWSLPLHWPEEPPGNSKTSLGNIGTVGVFGDTLLVGDEWGSLSMVEAGTGAVRWSVGHDGEWEFDRGGHLFQSQGDSVILADGAVLQPLTRVDSTTGKEGDGVETGLAVAYDSLTGRQFWTIEADMIAPAPTVDGQSLLVIKGVDVYGDSESRAHVEVARLDPRG